MVSELAYWCSYRVCDMREQENATEVDDETTHLNTKTGLQLDPIDTHIIAVIAIFFSGGIQRC